MNSYAQTCEIKEPFAPKRRFNEKYATDTWFSSVTSYEGYNCAQIFHGVNSKFTSYYGMQSESNEPDALLDFFRQEGVPISIIRDNSRMQTSTMWQDYCRRFWVKDEAIEPYRKQQNPAEREMNWQKEKIKRLMITTKCISE